MVADDTVESVVWTSSTITSSSVWRSLLTITNEQKKLTNFPFHKKNDTSCMTERLYINTLQICQLLLDNLHLLSFYQLTEESFIGVTPLNPTKANALHEKKTYTMYVYISYLILVLLQKRRCCVDPALCK